MKIKVKFYSLYREIIGKKEIFLEIEKGKKLKDVLELIFDTYPETEKLREFTFLSLNHRHASGEEFINEGDEIAIFLPSEGGSLSNYLAAVFFYNYCMLKLSNNSLFFLYKFEVGSYYSPFHEKRNFKRSIFPIHIFKPSFCKR